MALLALARDPKAVDDALSDLEASVAHSGNSHTLIGNLGFAYAITGRTEKANQILEQLIGLYKQQKATGQTVAKVYAGLGLKDEAFKWLEEDFKVRSGDLPQISWHPAFQSLHGDQRFNNLLGRMELEPRPVEREGATPSSLAAGSTRRPADLKSRPQLSNGAHAAGSH